MSIEIKRLIKDLLELEGGYVNHPHDKGGPTKYGITLKTLIAYRGHDIDANDIRWLSMSEAANIYTQNYYLAPGIDKLPELIQPVTFDMAVNMGPVAAIKLVQQVLYMLGSPITVDGHLGPRSYQSAVIACNVNKADILRNICLARKEFYRDLVDKDPKQSVFLTGWINRANHFLTA
jgi:lysozyme family protein